MILKQNTNTRLPVCNKKREESKQSLQFRWREQSTLSLERRDEKSSCHSSSTEVDFSCVSYRVVHAAVPLFQSSIVAKARRRWPRRQRRRLHALLQSEREDAQTGAMTVNSSFLVRMKLGTYIF